MSMSTTVTNADRIATLSHAERCRLVVRLLDQFIPEPRALARILEEAVSREGLTVALEGARIVPIPGCVKLRR